MGRLTSSRSPLSFHSVGEARQLMKEAHRVLKPGGTFVMTDNNPQSPVIQIFLRRSSR